MSESFNNVIITGSSMGLGASVATTLANAGKTVYALARNEKKLKILAESDDQGRIIAMPCDITNTAQLGEVIDEIESRTPIHALINNAAVFDMRNFWEQDLEMMDRIIDTNLKGLIYSTRLTIPHMIKRQHGRIINIASVAGTRGIPQQAAYCASKHGVVGFADSLAQELIKQGITVSTLCPGGISTPLWTDKGIEYPGDVSQIMSPQEVSDLVAFILDRPVGTSYKKLIFFPNNEWH